MQNMFTLSFRGSCFLQIKLKSNHEHNQKRTQKVSDYLKLCMEKVNFLEDFLKHYESNTYATRKRKVIKMCFIKIQQHTRGCFTHKTVQHRQNKDPNAVSHTEKRKT